MNTSKIIKAYIRDGTYSVTEPITQGDYGYILQIEGAELPNTYRVDFANDRHHGEALSVYGDENGVEVPEELIATGKNIYAFYFYLEEGFGKTSYTWKIPNDTRAKTGDREPTPTQQDSIDQALVALNEAVEQTGQDAQSASESAQSAREDADFLRNASAFATTLVAGSEATANLTGGEFVFGIPRGESYADVRFSDNVGYVPVDSNGIITKNTTITIDVRPMYGLDRMYSTNISGFSTLAAFKDGKVYAIQPRIFTESQYGITSFTYAFEEGYELKSMLYPMNLTVTAKTSNIPSKSQTLTFSKKFTIVVDKQGVKGDTGDTGPQGIQGEIGPQGPSGENAVNIVFDTDAIFINVNSSGRLPSAKTIGLSFRVFDGNEAVIPDSFTTTALPNVRTYSMIKGLTNTISFEYASNALISTTSGVVTVTIVYNGETYTRSIPYSVIRDALDAVNVYVGKDGMIIHVPENGILTRDVTVEIPVRVYDGTTLVSASISASTLWVDKRIDDHTIQRVMVPARVTTGQNASVSYTFPAEHRPDYYNTVNITITYKGVSYVKNIAYAVVEDGAKGDKGDKGDTGDDYVLTQADKQEIADMVEVPSDYLKAFPTDTASGAIASFTDGADNIPLKSLVVDIEPVQDISSGDPSPENICPISGWTGCNVQKTGKNLINIEDRVLSVANYLFNGAISLPHGEYTLTYTTTATESGALAVVGVNGNNQTAIQTISGTKRTWHITADVDIASMRLYGSAGDYSNFQLELGSTATDYEPYQGQTIPISWQTEAGTVYGGKLDVLSGELVVDKIIKGVRDYVWRSFTDSGFDGLRTNEDSLKVNRNSLICSHFKRYIGSTLAVGRICSGTWYYNLAVCLPEKFTTQSELFAYADEQEQAGTPIQIGFKLAEPVTYQLTPQEVNSLLGVNNIFADTGDCSVQYRADTTLYIQRLTEPDSDMVADSNITSGKYFMVGNNLYLATANIASGASVIVGTNCTRKSLSEALNEINV